MEKKDEINKEKLMKHIKDSVSSTRATIKQIKEDTNAKIIKGNEIVKQYIEESNKYREKRNKQLDLMNERLQSAAQENPEALFAEMDKLTAMMDSYSDDEVIQAVKDKQLKDAKID